MLFNEPKLLKLFLLSMSCLLQSRFSALQRAEIAEIVSLDAYTPVLIDVSVLFNEPKLLKY